MPDNLQETGKRDDSRINIQQPYEVDYWSKELGVTKEQLRAAVERAGPMVADVRRNLQQRTQ